MVKVSFGSFIAKSVQHKLFVASQQEIQRSKEEHTHTVEVTVLDIHLLLVELFAAVTDLHIVESKPPMRETRMLRVTVSSTALLVRLRVQGRSTLEACFAVIAFLQRPNSGAVARLCNGIHGHESYEQHGEEGGTEEASHLDGPNRTG